MCTNPITKDEGVPWERQPGESLPAWSAFRRYRDLEHRSLSAAFRRRQRGSLTDGELDVFAESLVVWRKS